jgi:hypothetical protein
LIFEKIIARPEGYNFPDHIASEEAAIDYCAQPFLLVILK